MAGRFSVPFSNGYFTATTFTAVTFMHRLFALVTILWAAWFTPAAVLHALAGNNSGQAFSIWPDTGQSKCYNNTTEISCPAPGEPFFGQDAQYSGPERSFTLLADGNIIRDNVTDLIWEMKQNNDGIKDYNNPHDTDNTYTWCDTNYETNGGNAGSCGENNSEGFINQINKNNFGGYNDWRLPTIKELVTILSLDNIDKEKIPYLLGINTTTSHEYWASTSFSNPEANNYAWIASFDRWSFKIYNSDKNEYNLLVAVRSDNSIVENQFFDKGDGTIIDNINCLQWQKDTVDINSDGIADAMSWQQALKVAEDLNLAGKSDWRLPSRNELQSITDFRYWYNAVSPVFIETTKPDSYYWSSTTTGPDCVSPFCEYAYTLWTGGGSATFDWFKKTENKYVRTVRGGQCGDLVSSGSFVFDSIAGPVTVGVGFPVRVEARTAGGALDTSVNGNISLTTNYGNIYPVILHFVNGVAEETVTVYGEGTNKQLRVWQYGGREGVSDYFAAVPDIPLRPVFRGYEGIGFRKLFGAIA